MKKREKKMYGGKKRMMHGGPHMEDKDMMKATMPRMGKAMGGQPSYASGEMPKAMPN